jgi:hypothetical protein
MKFKILVIFFGLINININVHANIDATQFKSLDSINKQMQVLDALSKRKQDEVKKLMVQFKNAKSCDQKVNLITQILTKTAGDEGTFKTLIAMLYALGELVKKAFTREKLGDPIKQLSEKAYNQLELINELIGEQEAGFEAENVR